MSERWLFVRWQSVFVKQPSNDNVAWWVWYVLLRNMPWWWVVAVTTFYICGWTTVVGVVWSCYEWSCLSYLVQCCCQTISVYYWFGRHGDGIVLICADMVVCGGEWWRRGGIEDVAMSSFFAMWVMSLHMRLIARWHRGGGMDECLLPCPLTSWCGVMLL